MAYKDLVIQISEESKHRFVASALEDGEPMASNSFELRLNDLGILERLWELENEAAKPGSTETFHIDFGRELYHRVLVGELESYLRKQLDVINGESLRISLQFDDSASNLSVLPWEFLHDGVDFLIARRNILISRLPSKMMRVQHPHLESILRMLVVISAPVDPSCAPIDAEKECDRILQAVDKLYVQHKIEVDFTDDATFETIQSYLNEKDYHIVHFAGHGKKINGQGYLVLETDDLRPQLVDNQTISDLFVDRGIRMVVLSACESADLADMLVRRGIPAVVAMQYPILESSAAGFAFAFYQAITRGKAIDLSITEARLGMRNAEGSNKVDFATPVLYLLDPDCLHIDHIKPDAMELLQKPIMLGEVQVMGVGFVGRKKELRILQKAFSSGLKRAAIVHGWGGIGKTVLSTCLAQRMIRHFEGVYAYKCNPQTRPEDILKGLNDLLNMAGIQALNEVLYQPVTLQVKTASLVNILNQRSFLVILDNFESCLDGMHSEIVDPELRQFVEHLLNATVSNSKYIITTRYDFDPLEGHLIGTIEHLSVPEMPFHQAMWLMSNHSELANLDLKKKKEIYKNIGGHPWTIDMFARHASLQTVDGLLLELDSIKRELMNFTLFEKSYNLLDASSRLLLLHASVFEEAMPIEALRWIVGNDKQPSPPVDKPLKSLIQWGLMARQMDRGESFYSEHTLIKEFVWQGLDAQNVNRKSLLIRAAQYYENNVKVNKNLWDLLRARIYYYLAEEWEKAAEIVNLTSEYLYRCGHVQLAIYLLNQSIETTFGIYNAMAKGNLGIIHRCLGDLERAIELQTEVKEIFEKEGALRNVANTLGELGTIYYLQGNYSQAIDLFKQTLKLFDEVRDLGGMANSLGQIGLIYYDQGNYQEAIKIFQESMNIFTELNDKHGISITLHRMSMIYSDQGDFQQASDRLQECLELSDNLGDEEGIGNSLHQLGNIYYLQGNYPPALELYRKSLEISKEMNDNWGVANSLGQIGMIYLTQGNYQEAFKKFHKCLYIFRQLKNKQGIEVTLSHLGDLFYLQQKYPEAAEHFSQSLDLAKNLGDKSGIARSLGQMGRIKEENKDFEGALGDYLTALSIFEELRDPNREIVKEDIARLREKVGEDAFQGALAKFGGPKQ
ncbi:MAG: tetratricopeptide repeat protein [Methanothrix sp.]